MLVDFTFENFKCYKHEATLGMTATNLSEHAPSLIEGLGNTRLLPIAAIYGPNGGGKSSVLQALECVQRLVTWPFVLMRRRGGKMPKIDCKPYAFDLESRKAPTTFKLVFNKGDYTYRYILSIREGEIVEEYLHRRKPGKGATAKLFEREGGKISLGSSLSRKGVNTAVDAMMPYISFMAINYDIDLIDEPFGWFLDCHFLDYSYPDIENLFIEANEGRMKGRMLELLNNLDINITNIRYQHDEEDRLDGIFLTHGQCDEAELELQDESGGTKKLISMLPFIIMALDKGTLLVSDELDGRLHPKLVRYIIKLFSNKNSNPYGAQLIFTSHDISTLNSDTFRRDEIWFAARGKDGSSELYSLSDIVDVDGRRIRPQNAYDRQYLAGQYGADPYLRNMLEWDEDRD